MNRLKEYTVGVELKKLVTLQINIVDESGIQVKRLKEDTVAVEVKKLVNLQIYNVSQSRIQVRWLL